jgi:hypothetical protein
VGAAGAVGVGGGLSAGVCVWLASALTVRSGGTGLAGRAAVPGLAAGVMSAPTKTTSGVVLAAGDGSSVGSAAGGAAHAQSTIGKSHIFSVFLIIPCHHTGRYIPHIIVEGSVRCDNCKFR